uniref:Uncharacterized protein n=1 Tax=Molossus molossus TaxID=27622 RepID=A0A7J8JV69_MOLMO|nr:hypothetical protein HJG59_007803 [Molossus molossus]
MSSKWWVVLVGSERGALSLLKLASMVVLSRGQRVSWPDQEAWVEMKASSCDLGSQPGVWIQPSWAPETIGGLAIKKGRCLPSQCSSMVERRPMHQEVTSSIPGQGTCPGSRPDPQWGVCRRQPINVLSYRCFCLSLFLPLPSCLSNINKEKKIFF